MKQASHTPGPWHTTWSHNDGDDLISVDAEHRHITLHTIEAEEDIANAQLIAVAPELLDELVKSHEIIKHLWGLAQEHNIPDSANWPWMREKERASLIATARAA